MTAIHEAAEALASINKIDLVSLQNTLIQKWLQSSDPNQPDSDTVSITSRHVKINGSSVSLTENSAVFRKTDFKKKITDFQKCAHSLTVFFFFLLKAISCDYLAEVAEKNQY